MKDLLKVPRILPVVALVLTIGTIVFLALPEPPPREAVRWNPCQPVETLKVDKPILLEVSSASCFPCVEMKYTTFQDRKVGKLINENFYPMRIEKDDDFLAEEKFIKKLGFRGFPTIYVFRKDGTLIESFVGYLRSYDLKWKLHRILKRLNDNFPIYRYPADVEKVGKDKPWLILASSRYTTLGKSLFRELHSSPIAETCKRSYYSFEIGRWPRLSYLHVLKEFSIRARPTLLIVNPESREVTARFVGLPTPGQLEQFLGKGGTPSTKSAR